MIALMIPKATAAAPLLPAVLHTGSVAEATAASGEIQMTTLRQKRPSPYCYCWHGPLLPVDEG